MGHEQAPSPFKWQNGIRTRSLDSSLDCALIILPPPRNGFHGRVLDLSNSGNLPAQMTGQEGWVFLFLTTDLLNLLMSTASVSRQARHCKDLVGSSGALPGPVMVGGVTGSLDSAQQQIFQGQWT